MADITVEETERAINAVKNNKTAGLDEIPAELLKYGGLSTIGRNTDEWHEQLLERKVCPRWLEKRSNHKAAKESDISDCNNWRGITLLSVPSSLLTNNIKPTSRCSWCNITRGAGWLPPRSIMHRTNFYIAQHYCTVREIPAATVNKLRRLQESIRQRAQTITVEYCQTVRNLTESVNNMLTFSWIEFQLLCENRHWSHWILRHHYCQTMAGEEEDGAEQSGKTWRQPTWEEAEHTAMDRPLWRQAAAQCATGGTKSK